MEGAEAFVVVRPLSLLLASVFPARYQLGLNDRLVTLDWGFYDWGLEENKLETDIKYLYIELGFSVGLCRSVHHFLVVIVEVIV